MPPPFSQGYPTSRSLDRPDREDLDDDHQYKRRRLEERPSAPQSMPDPPRPPNVSGFPPPLRQPFYGLGSDSFSFTPAPPLSMSSGAFWEEDAALEYLASGNGFAQDLRGLVPTFALPYNIPVGPPLGQLPPRTSEVTSHPVYQHPRAPPAIPPQHQALPEDFFQHLPSGVTNERLREVAGRVSESTRYLMATHFGRTGPLPQDENRTAQLPAPVLGDSTRMQRSLPPASIPSKAAIVVTLSRATPESIGSLEEHKRECPACQLEFEPDNFMAVISCCDTAMHVACLSAWVNSQTYAKSKTCMKCRRSIDARRPLNHVVPPVNDKTWDEGGNFDAPEHVKGDNKIDVNVSTRPTRPSYRRPRGLPQYTTAYQSRGATIVLPATLTPETREALTQARHGQMIELDEMKGRMRAAYIEQSRATEEDINARQSLLAAMTAVNSGDSADLALLTRLSEEKKLAKDQAVANYQKLHGDLVKLQSTQMERMNTLVANALREQQRLRVATDQPSQGLPLPVETPEAETRMSISP
ncbi:hypothetical protein HRR83_006949 [Exophiala dermatitidis]|uniref:RING-type domain-containing protein n=2 Tax=Exophiala dermatitidis TaxID=5970 RepID=H6BKC6_EXODN|nr:uncharacterized protein HMPREF1120_00771 [Exophiala dermatitidis NIH/UT8656]KAJ4509732.1 hypothetical protein HRR75_005858 [Exophiala dermatitidis]EHY52560.1 hypothetical protein HMPREF1120_00771 [Exophiala dermatitidis NIH/UT8656]KAJ4512433.1 hypothetical protein HRR73_005988 [Exophiala dermatitidis]KAJ4512692.1 hypothetical protein HRR74_006390 [Exophiala dermatitidis]KAJ4542496.1 hypothetical protein HRR77_005694 [Exophiala dermatitidis]